MFSYYGSKSKLLPYYPMPLHGRIIEPFCGSARYALMHAENDVLINDIDPAIYGIWQWYLQCSLADIEKLPKLKRGDDIRDIKWLSKPERDLLGFIVNEGCVSPRFTVTRWSYRPETRTPAYIRLYKALQQHHPRTRHWKASNVSYEALENANATWFVDPPYVASTEKYPYWRVDYPVLAEWCKSRNGFTIVCEGYNADWLPFNLLKLNTARGNTYRELIWTSATTKAQP